MVFKVPKLNETSSKRALVQTINFLADRVAALGNIKVRGKGVRSSVGPTGVNINIKPTSGGGSLFVMAKTQEDGITTDGLISVKRIDAEGNDIDSEPFDVWVSLNKSPSIDMTKYWPKISNAQIVLIEKINTEWFLLFPQIMNVGKW